MKISMTQAQKDRQARELARLPVGTRVRVVGCPGLGQGVVRELLTEHVMGPAHNRITVPLIGWVEVRVEFEDGVPSGRFRSTELSLVRGKTYRTRA
jgi:hypothetical protein